MPSWFEPIFVTLVVVLYVGMWPLMLWVGIRAIDEYFKPQDKGKK